VNIQDFAGLTDTGYPFDLKNPEGTAAALERIAANLRSGKYVMQRAEIYDRATVQDYTMRTLGITFCEKQDPVARLDSSESPYPVDLAQR
jgi:hypothetical protein